ncbi:MAG: hypothetical protein JWP02_3866 [Acidimicrobiales bacterium]|nr:hypothetical protein [Acidimicrobiales bacterium]
MTTHPDPDALSAFFDGDTAEWEEHVEGCAECRQRLAGFETVRSAVAAPVALPDARQQQAAVAEAMATVLPDRQGPRVPRWTAIAGAGAIAAGLVVGAVVMTRGDRARPTSSLAAQAAAPVSAHLVEGGDLGEVADAQVLHDKLQPNLGGPSSAASAQGTAGARSPMAATPAAGSDTGASAKTASGAAPAGGTVPAKRLAGRRPVPCEATARALQPGEEVLTYVADARWQGTPAEVLGFSPADAPGSGSGRPAPTRVYVLARSGCRLLVFQSFAP